MRNYIDSNNLLALASAGEFEALECLELADRRSATRAKAAAKSKALKAAREWDKEVDNELRIAFDAFEREQRSKDRK